MKMKIAVLTSSRADYGIYFPLLKALQADSFFQLEIIAFGTHVSPFYGHTIEHIEQDGFRISEKIESLILGDSKEAISNAIGNTITKFSSIWQRLQNKIDLVIALGDRYEMFAAVTAAIPFNLKIAHLHGGETTLGAIDNTFRHAITLMSSLHFVSTKTYAEKVKNLIGTTQDIYNVGALSMDNLKYLSYLSINEFQDKYRIDLSIPTILSTFHPETVSTAKNIEYTNIIANVFEEQARKYQIIITMPNADTMGSIIRKRFNQLESVNSNIICVENFGLLGYLSCMKHCSFLLGNTSSGIVEAAFFPKRVINIGKRQDGRLKGNNIIDVPINSRSITEAINKLNEKTEITVNNIYGDGETAARIIEILKMTYAQ